MPQEIKEKCIHNVIAKGNGERNWHCVDCGKSVKSPKEKEKIIEDWEKEFLREVQKELGYASSLFMSQECKGTEIIMPTKELEEVSDRIGLYLFKLLSREKQKAIDNCLREHSFQCCQILRGEKKKLVREIEKKKWTFVEGLEISEKSKKAIIRIHNQELEELKQRIAKK